MSRLSGERTGPARWRSAVAALSAGLLLAGAVGFAAPAAAAPLPTDAWWYKQMRLPDSWQISQGAGVIVGLVDSGVNADVGDLRGQVLPGKDFTGAGDAQADTGEPNNPRFGHGTDMAALIAGTGNGAGIKGVAPQAKILPVRVGAAPDGSIVAAGIKWAVDHGAQVVNVSLGGADKCAPDAQSAVDYAVAHDVIVVAGTGDVAGPVSDPANCVGAIAVGGIEPDGTPWVDSAYGPELDFVAPANHLQGLWLDGTLAGPGGFGTSQATAFVSGTFALLRSKFPTEKARQIVTRALWNVHNGLGGKIFAKRVNDHLGYGEILPYYALTEAPPTGAANPIYDKIDAYTKAHPRPTTTAPSPAPSPAATLPGASSQGNSSGIGVLPIIAIVVVIAVVIGLSVLLTRRSRRPTQQ